MVSLSLACSRTVMDEMCLICFANKENNDCLIFIIDDVKEGLQLVSSVDICYTS